MHRDRGLRVDPAADRIGGVLWAHREVAADGQQHQVGLVVLGNKLHVAEQAGVAHVPDLETVLELDDVAHRLAGRVRFVLAGDRVGKDVQRRVLGLHRRDLDARQRRDVAALVEAVRQVGRQHAQGVERRDHVGRPVQDRVVQLGQRRCVADMVDVRMRHQQQVDLAQRRQVGLVRRGRLGATRDPRVDDDRLAARRLDAERRLTQPEHFGLAGHRGGGGGHRGLDGAAVQGEGSKGSHSQAARQLQNRGEVHGVLSPG